MTLSLAGMPLDDRPRERLISLGPAALTTAELLAILIGTGAAGEGVMTLASRVLASTDGSLRRLGRRPAAELTLTRGMGPAKAARILAAIEVGARLARERRQDRPKVNEPEDVVRLMAPRLRDLQVEEFHLLALDVHSQVIRTILVTRGILDSSLVHPREVFGPAIAESAAGVIVVHNHPSGDPTPSTQDKAVTDQLVAAGQLLDMPLYDHIVIAGDRFVSFADAGLL